MTKIRKVVKRQNYIKTQYKDPATKELKVKYKRRYERLAYLVQFPKSLDITDLLGKELTFEYKIQPFFLKLSKIL